ncbi:MAG TPA: ATP-binding cassette domain-containing protein [Solirubrobacteraceae bacterium]|jgi:ABC-type methionine transport system ATPase subunit|nr:ATP-binding cassette domain-containing protein [Solirubrobacteraceae bacterium]
MGPGSLSGRRVHAPLLSFANVGKHRCEGERKTVVLESVSFELQAGSALGIYGQRRSGKSTLLRLAVGLELPDGGSVRFEGRGLESMSGGERARLLRGPIALLTADGWLPSPGETVMDHVAMSAGSAGLSLREARRRALAALDCVGVAGASAEEMTVSLAPDTRARVMLARALVREPRLLAVDEPAPLPALLERERFCALLREVARERSIALLVASEELSALQGIASLASLSAGELCSTEDQGTVVEFPRRRAGAVEGQ